jgi:predicted amidophosphoribosyltransferase
MTEESGKTEKKHLFCPYCDKDISELQYPYCDVCKIEVFYCPECRQPVPRENRTCPKCGAEIKG